MHKPLIFHICNDDVWSQMTLVCDLVYVVCCQASRTAYGKRERPGRIHAVRHTTCNHIAGQLGKEAPLRHRAADKLAVVCLHFTNR